MRSDRTLDGVKVLQELEPSKSGIDDHADASDLPWQNYVRHLFLDPVATPLFFICFTFLINLLLMWSQGGPDRMREIIAKDVAAAKKMKEEKSADMQLKQMQDLFKVPRRSPGDDNYAK